jgi:hypothetical protein
MDEITLKFKQEGSHYWVETEDRKFHINNRRSTVRKVKTIMNSGEVEAEDADEAILKLTIGEEAANYLIEADLPMPVFFDLTNHILASFDGTTAADVKKAKNA